jgi:KDO2-lipid IV(A) lauroyltransferase
MLRSGPGRFTLCSYPALDTASLEGTLQTKIKTVVNFYTQAVEDMVRPHPEQWFWLHKRWKSRPRGEKIVDPAAYPVLQSCLVADPK